MQMGHVGFNCHTFFLCVHLAGWSSRCAVCAFAPAGSNKCLLLLAAHSKTHIGFLDILGGIKGQYPFYYRSAESMSQTPIRSASTKKKLQSLRHLLQSAEGSSLVTYTSTFSLWCLL